MKASVLEDVAKFEARERPTPAVGEWEHSAGGTKVVANRRGFLKGLLASGSILSITVATMAKETAAVRLIQNDDDRLTLDSAKYQVSVLKRGYVSGTAKGSFYDKKTGARDCGFGLDSIDFLIAHGPEIPGTSIPYVLKSASHQGHIVQHLVEGPQICGQAKQLRTEVIQRRRFTAVKQSFEWYKAEPGRTPGSHWEQWLAVFRSPPGFAGEA